MAVLNSCLCCSLLLGTIIAGVYATLIYLAAFIITVWWIAESEMGIEGVDEVVSVVPLPGYLLCIGYLVIIVMSIFMLHGLYKQNEKSLLAWLFVMVLFFFPEMGIVLFMSLYHWRISTNYGLTELVFYIFRAGINLICLVGVQAQYTIWRDRSTAHHTLKRLHELQMNHIGKTPLPSSVSTNGHLGYHNPGFVNTETESGTMSTSPKKINGFITQDSSRQSLSRSLSTVSQLGAYRLSARHPPSRGGLPGWDPYIQTGRTSQSEFNASLYASPGGVPVINHTRSEHSIYQDRVTSPIGLYSSQGQIGLSPLLLTPISTYSNIRAYPAQTVVHPDYCTQSLDRRRYHQRINNVSPTVEALNLRAPLAAYIGYGRPTIESKSSLGAESDDHRRYRDVAL